jgi:quinol monooxygenase YgiN
MNKSSKLSISGRADQHDTLGADAAELRRSVPILRIFRARAKRGYEAELGSKLASTSVDVVRNQPGFIGYLCGKPATDEGRDFVFASIWRDADALKKRFGKHWRVSYLPPGYAEIIEDCSVEHYHLTDQVLIDDRRR